MDYNEATFKSKWKIQRFAHISRYNLASNLCKNAGSVLDYGTGSGHLLILLSNSSPTTELTGYEPVNEMYLKALSESNTYNNINIVNKIDYSRKFDFITCLEVLEHLTIEEQVKVFIEFKKLLSDKGKIIISIPIETGLSGFFKNVFRYMTKHSHAKNLKEVFQALLGLKIKRKVTNGYIYSHVGYRYKDLEEVLSMQNMKIIKRIFSPFNFLGSVLNSQIFYIIEFDELDNTK